MTSYNPKRIHTGGETIEELYFFGADPKSFVCNLLATSSSIKAHPIAWETSEMNTRCERWDRNPMQPTNERRVQGRHGIVKEDKQVNRNKFLNPKKKVKCGLWNVRTMQQEGKLEQLVDVFDRYSLDLCAITETRLTGVGKSTLEGGKLLLQAGRMDGYHYQGVGLLISKEASHALEEWEPINERTLMARLKSRHGKLSIIVNYAPTEDADIQHKNDFYGKLQEIIDKIPKHDVLICLGDFNAKLGSDNEGWKECMGVHGMGEMNDNGIRLASFCLANELMIGGTLFEHRNIHKYTWRSPCGKYLNQIDHCAINKQFKSSLLDVRTRRGADIGSDHQLVIATLRLKLKAKKPKTSLPPKYNSEKLRQQSNAKENFIFECRNRFAVLDMLSDEEEMDVNAHNKEIENIFQETANSTLGRENGHLRKKWMSDETWSLIKQRKNAKLKYESLDNDSPHMIICMTEYKSLNSEVKRSCRSDKRKFINSAVEKMECNLNKGEAESVRNAYKGIQEITGKKRKGSELPVRDKHNNILTKESEIKARWKEHFEETLNRQSPPDEEDIPEADHDLPIDVSEIRLTEVKVAIKQLKNHKAPGFDGISPEMLKADEIQTPIVMKDLFNHIWQDEITPDVWKQEGIMIKVPKKGDLRDCSNWRGITLSSTCMKVFSKVILNRIEPALDRILRKEQAGFCKGKGCADQIFILRHITQQCNEMRSPLVLCFVDFEKAFDSISRNVLKKL